MSVAAQVEGYDVVVWYQGGDGEDPVCGVAGPAVDEEEGGVGGGAVGGVEDFEGRGGGEEGHGGKRNCAVRLV